MARTIKHPGITQHARALGCSPGHLSQVADGTRPSPELLARYRALVALDPDSSKGVKVGFLPAGTAFADCTPDQLAEAKEFGTRVSVKGTSIVLQQAFTFALGTKGPAIVQPVAEAAPEPAAADTETLSTAGDASPATPQK